MKLNFTNWKLMFVFLITLLPLMSNAQLLHCKMEDRTSFFISIDDRTLSYYDEYFILKTVPSEEFDVTEVSDEGSSNPDAKLTIIIFKDEIKVTLTENYRNGIISYVLEGKEKSTASGVCSEIDPTELF